MANGEGGRKDGRTWKFTRVLQDIGPLGPLPKKEQVPIGGNEVSPSIELTNM